MFGKTTTKFSLIAVHHVSEEAANGGFWTPGAIPFFNLAQLSGQCDACGLLRGLNQPYTPPVDLAEPSSRERVYAKDSCRASHERPTTGVVSPMSSVQCTLGECSDHPLWDTVVMLTWPRMRCYGVQSHDDAKGVGLLAYKLTDPCDWLVIIIIIIFSFCYFLYPR